MTKRKPRAAFLNNNTTDSSRIHEVYSQGRRQRIEQLTDLYPHVVSPKHMQEHGAALSEIDVGFSTWGMPLLTDEQLDAMPALRAVFYAAGSVKSFATPLLARDITVVSGWAANAVPVAEFTLAQILLACKGYFANTHIYGAFGTATRNVPKGNGVYGEKVALIGAGQIGRRLAELLKPFALDVLVVDPFLADDEIDAMGVTRVDLDTAFREAYVISNHLPNLPELKHVINGRRLASMRPSATFINTGRGAQVAEDDLIAVFSERRDLTALLDVTSPEPPVPESPLRQLDNVHLSSHIAGAINDEVLRLADIIIEEFELWRHGKPLNCAITLDMLKRMA